MIAYLLIVLLLTQLALLLVSFSFNDYGENEYFAKMFKTKKTFYIFLIPIFGLFYFVFIWIPVGFNAFKLFIKERLKELK